MKVESYAISDQGRVRTRNEDSYLNDDRDGLYIVADGMGGHVGGDIASRMAVERIREIISRFTPKQPPTTSGYDSQIGMDIEQLLIGAIKNANEYIYNESQRRPEYRGMGTTSTTVLIENNQATIAHVGDSRAYLVRNGTLKQITEDHSWVNEQVKAGFITSEEARNHRLKNVITRSLGHEKDVQVDIVRLDLQELDKYLLCSDGLSNMVSDAEIKEVVARLDIKEALEVLVDLANERGGYDNITAVLVQILGR